jgi:ssRNA-specific RNase YbeY (16S rRNA maturation enzyme)
MCCPLKWMMILQKYIYAYIKDNYPEKTSEEIIRTIIHGILHIEGYDHKDKFDKLSDDSEEMFKVQERIVSAVLKDLGMV